ncbi:hypothetical protein Tco_0701371 [Tanacetum coccineum]
MENNDSGVTTLRSCLKVTKVRSIDGKILGKDGNPMRSVLRVIIVDTEGVNLDTQNPNVDSGDTSSASVVDVTKEVKGSDQVASSTNNVTPLFLHIAAKANMGYYFKV